MAISFPRPDLSSPASIAGAEFPTARRGYDQRQVRELLRNLAAELDRLMERERFLQHELRTVQETTVDTAAALDEETVSRVLGEETLRVLQTARESANQIKARAEESAARIIREASEDAGRIRSEAEVEAARVRSDASADAEAELSLAKQQGREMVNEARAYRERVLSELSRRRDAARLQIEQLASGRDRLLQVFERARLVAVDVMGDLTPLGEPEEYVNLDPTTGPIPMMVPTGSANGTGSDVDDVSGSELDAVADTHPDTDTDTDTDIVDTDIADAIGAGDADGADPAVESPDEVAASNVVSLFGGSSETDDADADADADADDVARDLFARLRAEAAASDETAATADETAVQPTEPDEPDASAETIFQRRDADLVPLILAAARKLKRVLADEQNEALDTLRGRAEVTDLDDLVPVADAHVERFASAIADELLAAARVGAELFGTDAEHAGALEEPGVLDPVRELIADGLVQPLRARLERSVADGAGENDQIVKRVRAVYREWKTTHIDDQLDDVLRLAHGVGAAAVLAEGTPMCWMVDPAGPACPDAEDNALAGVVPAGEPYPTGHRLAPAHPGCRCLIAPAGN
jgi:DivIVA domain-containing protein